MATRLVRIFSRSNFSLIVSDRSIRYNMQAFRYCWPLPVVLSIFPSVHSFSSSVGTATFATSPTLVVQVRQQSDDEDDDLLAGFMSATNSELANEYSTNYHAPVMWSQCIEALLQCDRARETKENDRPLIFVDGTLGGGGHSAALLERIGPGDILLGCDVDPNALQTASDRLEGYMNHDGSEKPHFIPVQSNFGDLTKTLPRVMHPVTKEPILNIAGEKSSDCATSGAIGVDGILLDLGVSSHQIDTPERGFAFMKDGPLDMRMGTDAAGGLTAADLCNELDAKELQRIFTVFGDEPRAKTIANAVVQHRPLSTTQDLVDAIGSVTPAFAKNKRKGKTATCARIFQSLRIVVNHEDRVLDRVLVEACPTLIRPGGRLVVLSYHSMEDRATKRIMRDGTLKKPKVEKDLYGNITGPPKPFKPIGKRQTATDDEVAVNPRARSASLRIAEKM